MKIMKKRIRNVKNYLVEFENGEKIRIGVKLIGHEKIAKEVGFTDKFNVGESIIPNGNISKRAQENVEGRIIIRKDLPKETAERYFEWSWKDRVGNEYSDYKYVPYERYQREYTEPKLYRFIIVEDEAGEKWIASETIENIEENYEDIKGIINLFLSIFHECEIVNEKFKNKIKLIKRLNWELLRKGTETKAKLKDIVDEIAGDRKKNMYIRNIDKLMNTSDETIAIGKEEFRGYIVFMYSKNNKVILESLQPNNATYVLGKNWEEVSKMTKTEVISKKAYIARIYHYSDWEEKIKKFIT